MNKKDLIWVTPLLIATFAVTVLFCMWLFEQLLIIARAI